MAAQLRDAVYGCLVAGAIGDSLGAPVEGWYYQDIRDEHGKVDHFMPFETGYSDGTPGTVTDDSVLRHYLCMAIVRKGGRVTPDDFAEVWLDTLNPDRLWDNERIVLQKLRIGMNPWDTGRGTPPTGCASMAIAPIGLVNAADPAQAYQDAFNIASINQDGPNRDAAATIAAAVAAAFLPGAGVQGVLDAMFEHSAEVVRRSLVLGMDLARASEGPDEFVEKFYDSLLDWTWPSRHWEPERYFSGSSLEILPAVAGILHLCDADVERCLVEGASFGRDCDTIAGIAGNIAGVLRGTSGIPQEWIRTVEEANQPFFAEAEGDPNATLRHMADRLVDVLRRQRRAAHERAAVLDELLGPE
ncbi:MAG: ADP-ribosylglycohydrolase family protein [Candidatus Brocadiia bacterium]